MTPLPSNGSYLPAIRRSSTDLRVVSGISITPEHIKRLLFSPAFTESFNRVSKIHGLALPLNFSSNLDELNFLSILSLLNFASGFRVPLHAQTGRGAWDSIRALAFSLYITSSNNGDLLSARGLRTLESGKIAELMGVSVHVERPHDKIAGVTVGELGGPLYELVKLIASVLNETGEILERSGYANLGTFVAEALEQAGKVQDKSDSAAVEVVLERLVRAFPGFRDMSEVKGQPVYCFKKALFLIHAITIRFGSITPPPFPIPNTNNIPVFSDNVLPSLLIHLGVIKLPPGSALSKIFSDAGSEDRLKELLGPAPERPSKPSSEAKEVPKEGPTVSSDESYILRAAAINACELIIETARSLDAQSLEAGNLDWIRKITLPNLDMWIWSVAKDRPDYRVLERFVDQNTVYF